MSLQRWTLASELLSDLSQQGVKLWADGDLLRFRAPEGTLTPMHRSMLADFKSELLDVLRDRPRPTLTCTLRSFVVNAFRQKCYVCHSNGEAVIVDPGCFSEREQQTIVDYIEENKLSVKHLLLTHAHVDHFYGSAFFARYLEKSFLMHAEDVPLLETADIQAKFIGSTVEPPPAPEGLLREGDTISFGEVRWHVFHAPGHSPGSICFYDETNGFIITGDVLFRGAVGNISMAGGSLAQLMASIQNKLLALPADTLIYPGHGPPTTIGFEQSNNTWLPRDY
ncbi:MBL fold metallo-hydrolase [Sorangium sp. So ce1389]|uniref:MBL fold metallo-hydrolase n=1 Tax=Sorangium sp. So ce1389 TaxID=3133336 RepID=UPI003F643FC6